MNSLWKYAYRFIAAGITVFISALISAQTPAGSALDVDHSPVGRWVAEHPSMGGIGSWWEFHADGTLTMFLGVAVADHIDRSGDTFMMPSGTVGEAPVRVKCTIHNDILVIDSGKGQPPMYSRIGTAPNPADPLIGSWRPIPNPSTTDAANMAVYKSVMATKGQLVFTPDGMEYLRVPLGTREGTWNGSTHSFRVQDTPGAYSFERRDSKLLLGQPPNGKEIDSYLPDPIPLIDTGTTQSAQTDANGAYRRGPGVVMPKVTKQVEASFTEEARRRKIGGTVTLQVTVNADGRVRNARVVKSAADAYSDLADREAAQTLDQKAIEAVRLYEFTPGTLHDKPVPVDVMVDVSFNVF